MSSAQNGGEEQRVRPVTFVACQSVLELDLGHVTAQRAVLDPQFLHKMVMSGFYGWVAEGEPNPRSQLRVLHAARPDLGDDLLTVVVQSRVQPDWDRVARAALRSRPRLLSFVSMRLHRFCASSSATVYTSERSVATLPLAFGVPAAWSAQ